MKTKKCTKCGKIKLLELFAKRTIAKDGHQHHCRDCHKVYDQKLETKRRPTQDTPVDPGPSESEPEPSGDNPADPRANTEVVSTAPGHCARCDTKMTTAGEYLSCRNCGWEDYGTPEPNAHGTRGARR